MTFTGKVRPHLIQTATAWPLTDEGWQTQYLWKGTTATISIAGNGRATFLANYGKHFAPQQGKKFSKLDETPIGQWCRIIVQDEDGTIQINDETYMAVWHGIIKSRRIQPTGGDLPAVRVTIEAAYITAAFEAVDVLGSYELNHESVLVDTYHPPIFNKLEGGDMHTGTAEIDGATVHVFDRMLERTPTRWTYGDAVAYLLAAARPLIPSGGERTGPRLTLGTLPAALATAPLPRNAGRGKNVIELLRSLINPAMGFVLVFRIDSSNQSMVVDVKCCSQADVVLWDEDLVSGVVPNPYTGAGATAVDIDILQDPTLFDMEIQESDDAEDYVLGVGGADTYAITLQVGGTADGFALSPCEWAVADEPGVDDQYGDIWRLFKFTPDWDGQQYDVSGDGLKATITHGADGTNGERTFGGDHPANSALNFTRELPFAASETQGGHGTPRIFIGSGTTDWEDCTNKIGITPMPGGLIRLGRNEKEARILKEAYDDGKTILVSIGVDNWHPLVKAWRRNEATPRDLPRVKRVDLPSHRTETMLAETIFGVDPDVGSLMFDEEETISEGDVPGFRNAVEAIAAKSQYNSTTLTFRTKGSMLARYDLGDPILSVSYGKSPNNNTIPVWAIITGQTLDFSAENFGIRYEALRVLR